MLKGKKEEKKWYDDFTFDNDGPSQICRYSKRFTPQYVTLGDKEIISCDDDGFRLSLNDLKIIRHLNCVSNIKLNGLDITVDGYSHDIGDFKSVNLSEIIIIIELLDKQ